MFSVGFSPFYRDYIVRLLLCCVLFWARTQFALQWWWLATVVGVELRRRLEGRAQWQNANAENDGRFEMESCAVALERGFCFRLYDDE